MNGGKYLTPKEVARYLDTSPPTVRRWIRDGWIPGSRKGGRWVILVDEFLAWKEENLL